MTALSTRVRRLEDKRPDDHDPVEILLVNICSRTADGALVTRPGFARFIGRDIPEMYPEERESKETFSARVDAALQRRREGKGRKANSMNVQKRRVERLEARLGGGQMPVLIAFLPAACDEDDQRLINALLT